MEAVALLVTRRDGVTATAAWLEGRKVDAGLAVAARDRAAVWGPGGAAEALCNGGALGVGSVEVAGPGLVEDDCFGGGGEEQEGEREEEGDECVWHRGW